MADSATETAGIGAATSAAAGARRHDWTRQEIIALFEQPFNDLLYRAQLAHRAHFDANTVQLSTLLSIKTGACPEDCKYCPQSIRYDTGLEKQALMPVEEVRAAAAAAKANGATRFCMGAAWRSPKPRDIPVLRQMIGAVRELGMETCLTAGMLSAEQAYELAEGGLDYYNHNLDTSPEFYGEVITTRSYDDRLQTLAAVRAAGMKVCCGGIVGMGEGREDRAGLLQQLACMDPHPESVPINNLVQVPGTPVDGLPPVDPFEFVRTIAVARILMPASHVRLSAGRETMSDELQALCFAAGANSIFYGERLLTTDNPQNARDRALFSRLGLRAENAPAAAPAATAASA